MTEVNIKQGIINSYSVQPNILLLHNIYSIFCNIKLKYTPVSITSNTSGDKSSGFELIDGDLPSKICSVCRVKGPVVAVKGGQYYCESCFLEESKG